MKGVLKILLLEDSPSDAEILKAFLLGHKPGCVFTVVMTEEAFLKALYEFEPDIIISDNTMPQYSASEALETFKKTSLNIPFILVTGTVSEEFAAGIIKAGADDYILKDRLTRLPGAIDAALQKKKTENQRKEAEEKVRFKADLLNAVGQAVIATDLKGNILYWNSTAEKMYGWQTEEVMAGNIIELFPELSGMEKTATVMLQLAEGKPWNGEFEARKKDGTVFPAFVSTSPFRDQEGNITGIISVSYDITTQKEAAAAMRNMEKKIAEQQLKEQKKISRAMIRGQEAEKNHIGKELHDNINQILAGAKMFLVMAAKKNENIKSLIQYPVELLDSSIEEIRRLTYRQVTPLKNIRLQEQLVKLIDSVQINTSLKTVLNFKINEEGLSDDLKLNLYRIVQEQINNIAKHAAAKNVLINVIKDGANIILMVSDDGKGFNTANERKGIGITNMMNRAVSYDGVLEINSSPGKGTVLTASIPG